MSSSIRYIDDQDGNHVFPVTHERAVRDSNGVTLETKLEGKVDIVSGKGLSTNDYTTTEKEKVATLVTSGDGSQYLADDGTYKTVTSGVSSVNGQTGTVTLSIPSVDSSLSDSSENAIQNRAVNAAINAIPIVEPVLGTAVMTTETWTFTLSDSSTVTKTVYVGV